MYSTTFFSYLTEASPLLASDSSFLAVITKRLGMYTVVVIRGLYGFKTVV